MNKRKILSGVLGLVCAGGLIAWRVDGQERAGPEAPGIVAPVPVVTAKVQVADFPIVMTGIGSVVAYNVVDVHAQVTGTIEKIGFVEGQTVHPGDLIAQLDPRPYQAALQQAEADLARDQAHLTNAQTNLSRYVPLEKQGFASNQQVTDQTSSVTQMEAAIASDKAAVFNAQTQLSYTTITSPIDGVTGIRRSRHWQYLAAEHHHANRNDHTDPADLGGVYAAAEGRARGAASHGQRSADDRRL